MIGGKWRFGRAVGDLRRAAGGTADRGARARCGRRGRARAGVGGERGPSRICSEKMEKHHIPGKEKMACEITELVE